MQAPYDAFALAEDEAALEDRFKEHREVYA
jgi:hypothetical protein